MKRCVLVSVLVLGIAGGCGGTADSEDAGDAVTAPDPGRGDAPSEAVAPPELPGDAWRDADRDVPVAPADAIDVGAADPGTNDAGGQDPGAHDPGVADTGAVTVPPCCGEGDSCPEGLVCEHSFFDGPGTCVPPLLANQCWGITDCGAKSTCVGVSPCACQWSSCAAPPTPGTCTIPGTYVCCDHDWQCEADEICAHLWGGYTGQCVPKPGQGQCYGLDECTPGYRLKACEGGVTCQCGAPGCTFTLGTCVYADWSQCCSEDAECDVGRCHHDACKPDVASGCWSDRDCGPGRFCQGERVCPCLSECEVEDAPGTCADLPSGCCNTGDDCGEGETCRGAGDRVPGRCLPPPGDQGCWEQADCPPPGYKYEYFCVGAGYCPCVAACPDCGIECPEEDTAGFCEWVPEI